MNRLAAIFLVLASLRSPGARAASFNERCPDIPTCAKVVGELLGQKYMFEADLKGKIVGTPGLELNRDNAELLFTNMLNLEGYSRVPLGQQGSYQILRQRDARDAPLPLVEADQRSAPTLPANWDLYTMRYKATHPESVEWLARTSRSFMPANSRIIPEEMSGILLVTDTAMNLKKLYEIIKEMDRKPSAELKRRWEERKPGA